VLLDSNRGIEIAELSSSGLDVVKERFVGPDHPAKL